MNRRALDIEVAARRVRTDHPVEITRLEFVRVLRQSLEIADAIIAGASLENIVEGQSAQGSVATGTAAADRHATAVDPLACRQIFGAVDAVIDVDNPPLAAQPL